MALCVIDVLLVVSLDVHPDEAKRYSFSYIAWPHINQVVVVADLSMTGFSLITLGRSTAS